MATTTNVNCCSAGQPADDSYNPCGKIGTIGQTQVYEAAPAFEGLTDGLKPLGIIVLIPDGFGLIRHNFLLADTFAAYGWKVVVPDIYEGDPMPAIYLRRNDPNLSKEDKAFVQKISIGDWLERHPHDKVDVILEHLVQDLLSQHGDNVGQRVNVVGYCYGGKHALRMAGWKTTRVSAAFHPSFVVAEDVQHVLNPIFIGLGEKDDMVPASLKSDLEQWMGITEGAHPASQSPTKFVVYPAMKHGFAARPDTKDPLIREQYLKSFTDTVTFFSRWLQC